MVLDEMRARISEVAKRVVAERRPGESRQELAKRIGVGDGTLGRLLKGEESNPRLDTIVNLAIAARLEPWQLLTDVARGGNRLAINEPTAIYRASDLASAVEQAEEIIAAAGNPPLAPLGRATVITTVLRLQESGVGMESAKRIVADLLATTTETSKHGTSG